MNNIFIHPNAIVETKNIGSNTRVWAFAHIMPKARLGRNCNICEGCFIENDVIIGNRVVIKNNVQIWDGITIEDNVFLGPNATLTNDLVPRAKKKLVKPDRTIIEKGASIGANATLLCGITIGKYAMVGAGAVVTKDVPSYALIIGNPGKFIGTVDKEGNRIK